MRVERTGARTQITSPVLGTSHSHSFPVSHSLHSVRLQARIHYVNDHMKILLGSNEKLKSELKSAQRHNAPASAMGKRSDNRF